MAKAAAKSKAPAGKVKAKGKKGKGAKAGGAPLWMKILALILLFPFAAVLLPTTLLFFVMMAPTWVAYITDRSREKQLAITVGMLNFTGTLPAGTPIAQCVAVKRESLEIETAGMTPEELRVFLDATNSINENPGEYKRLYRVAR